MVHGDQRAVVVGVGGGLRTYSVGEQEVLDGYGADEKCTSGRGQVLIPWPNRIEDGTYELDGARHQLPLTEPEHRNAIHGLVRGEPWTVAEQERSGVRLTYELQPQPGYPFSLALELEYSLSDDGLRVQTTATNVGGDAAPYGSGAHPYLRADGATVDSATLRIPARTVLHSNERGLPVGSEPVEGSELDFRRPRPIGATVLDHAFTDLERGEDRLARVELADRVSLWVDERYPYLMIFTGDPLPDVARRSLAVEPMTCPPNAFRSGEGVIRLEPGESARSTWGIIPSG
ncbi:MAG TPA: aldose 1-epimerase family protein [Gaiellaceae bacterium]|nr:aldose 1-epimerase family protein [Gaiellaceae bacterium]